MIGRPYPAFTHPQMSEAVVDVPRLIAIGVAVNPGLDRIPVLGARDAQGDERRQLREHVLVQLCWPLCDRDQAKAEGAAAASDSVNLTENARHVAHRLLGSEGVRLLEHEP